MSIPTHENKFVKNCLNCDSQVTDLNEEHLHCSQCGFPIRNECYGTSRFNSGYGNNHIQHDINDEFYVLEPDNAYCPKCGSISLFAEKGLLNVKHPKVEVINPPPSDEGLPF